MENKIQDNEVVLVKLSKTSTNTNLNLANSVLEFIVNIFKKKEVPPNGDAK